MHLKHSLVIEKFELFLRGENLKLTPQRRRILDRVYATHEHFSADTLYAWLREEEGPQVSRATVYRTLDVLSRGGFVQGLDTGDGGMVYEHVLGHDHHDHLVCVACGRIDEFSDPEIEKLQVKAARSKGFTLVSHVLRLSGFCESCQEKRAGSGASEETGSGPGVRGENPIEDRV